ncbi:MAG: OmpA family protein [Deltaproteobacteria bacterium]|jgi:outer membrane protein OmpA-like peptidoglycan-associated protein|nr:OmpA family protein [Deltaproteobacteria bacterium]
MQRANTIVFGMVITVVLMGGFTFAQEDKKGCADPELFTRVPGFYLDECEIKDFGAHEFIDPVTKEEVSIEGRFYSYYYYLKDELSGRKSMLQIARNYSNAIDKIGGVFFMDNPNGSDNTWMKVTREGKEIWAAIEQDHWEGETYYLYIVEKEAMKQEVVANADVMADGISSTGHVALYGIYFDFNKSDLKPESEPTLNEIAKLITGNPNLKVFIVGHTDNVGDVDYNMKLSQARADAVAKALTTKYKVSPQNLKAYGVGQLAPVASNKTEEGRSKNRRVELVEQ